VGGGAGASQALKEPSLPERGRRLRDTIRPARRVERDTDYVDAIGAGGVERHCSEVGDPS
jgi:hypothetical protein